jgi:cytochrome b561
MSDAAPSVRYSAPAQLFHWLSALLVAFAWLLGNFRDAAPRGEPRQIVDFVHISSGEAIVILFALRVAWRFLQPAPAAPGGVWADRAAKLAQLLLYVLLVAAPVAGLVTLFAAGKPLPLFGLGEIPSPWAQDKAFEHAAKEVHEWLANGLVALATLHAGAALLHHFRLRDDTLRRMLPRAMSE